MNELVDIPTLYEVVENDEECFRNGAYTSDPWQALLNAFVDAGGAAQAMEDSDTQSRRARASVRTRVYCAARASGFSRFEVEEALLHSLAEGLWWHGPVASQAKKSFTWAARNLGFLLSDARDSLLPAVWLSAAADLLIAAIAWDLADPMNEGVTL